MAARVVEEREEIGRETGKKIVRCLRLGREAEANQQMPAFIDYLTANLTAELLEKKPQLTSLFAEMLDAQQKRDLLRLADSIEYRLMAEI